MSSLTDPFPTLDQLPHPMAVPAPTTPAVDGDAVARGYEEGLRRGYEEGARRAAEDARSDLSYALTALHTAIEDLHRRDAATVDDVSGEVVDLAMAVAEIILGHEIDAAIDPGRDALARALAVAPDRGAAVARLHPLDLERLGDVASLTADREVRFVADPNVTPGGCMVDVGAARIDAQIPAALERVRAALVDAQLCDDVDEIDGLDGLDDVLGGGSAS